MSNQALTAPTALTTAGSVIVAITVGAGNGQIRTRKKGTRVAVHYSEIFGNEMEPVNFTM